METRSKGHLIIQGFSAACTGARSALRHTPEHRDCPACIEADVLLIQLDSDFSRLSFSEAATAWLALRLRSNLKTRTHVDNEQYVRQLRKFFGPIRLCDITPGHLKQYQDARKCNRLEMDDGSTHRPWARAAGNSIINHELSALGQILKRAKLWPKLQPYYFPLPIPKWSPRDVLSEEDEEELFRVAASHPEAALAYWCACITNNTTAVGSELRGLKLKHVFLRAPGEISEIYIPPEAVKNSSRPRKIALNRTARWAIDQCYKRALQLGSCRPEHYLFPFRVNRKIWDPERPASRWFLRKSWEKLRAATGFAQVTPYQLRHQCITRLLENGVNPETVKAIAGHVTDEMLWYYSHQRRQVKYEAVMAIELDEQRQRKQGPRAVKQRA
jgi:integrase